MRAMPAPRQHCAMDKITSILAVVESPEGGAVVLGKAVAIARRCHARVELLIAGSRLSVAMSARCAALGFDDITRMTVFRSGENLATLLLRHAVERRCDLIIKEPDETGDAALAGECPVPVLIAGARLWSEPPRFAASVDISDPETAIVARGILQAAGFLALACHGHLDILYCEREAHDETLRMERAVKLAQLVREFHVGGERLQMFDGSPENRLPSLIAMRHYDVLALGAVTHREKSLASGDLTRRLTSAAGGDILLIPPIPGVRRRDYLRAAINPPEEFAPARAAHPN
jgi:hypothetical protein